MSQRKGFVERASQADVNMSELCREYGISRKTGYKWLKRYRQKGIEALQDQSRRPQHSPRRTAVEMEQLIVATRQKYPAWGGRKIRSYLEKQGHPDLPVASTITAILERYGQTDPLESLKHRAIVRFERPHPNELWQMDFKGCVELGNGTICYPLSLLDDHSRYLLCLEACPNESQPTVQARLTDVFQRFGLPQAMLMDNAPIWGYDPQHRYTALVVWLIRLGIRVLHGRPHHPQTQGKVERFHRTLQTELIRHSTWQTLEDCQQAFDAWRSQYNDERPHQALNFQPPSACYQASSCLFPNSLPALVYPPNDLLRKVDLNGDISFHRQILHVGKAFQKHFVALRPTGKEHEFLVFFGQQPIVTVHFNALQ
jgi:transposase InsO family protein